MAFRINHIHLKAPDPRKTAEWYEKAFAFKIVSDETRVFGDRFIRCQAEDGSMAVNISGARTNEKLGPGDANPHHGLEHFGFDSEHLETDIARLEKLGAKLLEGPIQNPGGARIAFLRAPDDCRVELVERRQMAGGAGCGCCRRARRRVLGRARGGCGSHAAGGRFAPQCPVDILGLSIPGPAPLCNQVGVVSGIARVSADRASRW